MQANIHCTVLTSPPPHPISADEPAETAVLLLDQSGYAKFQQVFLGQRCVRLAEYGEHTFWDSRTGLTIHMVINSEPDQRSEKPAHWPSHYHPTYQID